MKRVKHFIKTRRILSAVILILLVGIGYYTYSKFTSTSSLTTYVVENAKIRNVVTTISGTGQVYASSQLDIKSKASGDLVYLNTAMNGQQVKKGQLIAQIDTRNALISLESARIAYEKLVQPADAPTLLQSQNSLTDAIQTNAKNYSDAYSSIVDTFIDLPSLLSSLNDMLYSRAGYLQSENVRQIGQTALDLQNKAGMSYDKAKAHYDTLNVEYKTLSNTSSTSTIETFVAKTYDLARTVSGAIKNAQNTIDYVKAQKNDAAASAAESSITSMTATISNNVTTILSSKNAISNSKLSIAQQTANLQKTVQGATDLDIASQKLQLAQAQNNYDDYFIRAPFDGTLARLSVKQTDTVSNGTIIGTIVSPNRVADITLNEVDVAKVKIGQKVKLTFDAIDELTLDGTVTTVDSVGTVTQGVVNYAVEISIDAQDDRIKSGMSTSAAITVDTKENVLTVSNSAVKTTGKFSSVSTFNPPLTIAKGTAGTTSAIAPTTKKVIIGVSNDTYTEIVSGLNVDDQVVTRTIAGTAAAKTAATRANILGGARTSVRGN